MAQHLKPGTGPVPSGGTGTESMTLSPETERAYQVWHEILATRAAADPAHGHYDPDRPSRLRNERLEAALAEGSHSVAAVLLRYAVLDARTRDLPPEGHQWEVDALDLEETLLYASVDPVGETSLRNWLTTYIERLPSWRVTIRERKPQPRQVHCRHCDSTFDACPDCHRKFVAKPETPTSFLRWRKFRSAD